MDAHASRVLGAVLDAVGDASGYPDVLSRICGAVADALPCDRVTLYAWSPRARTYLPKADHGTPAEVVSRFIRRGFAARHAPGTESLLLGRVYVVSRETAEGETASILDDAEMSAMAVAPLGYGGQTEGALSCGFNGTGAAFSPEQIEALQCVASHAALLVRNSRLESEAARLAARRTWLATWAAQVFAATDLLHVGQLLSEVSQQLFRATGAWLLLLEGDELVSRETGETDRGTELARIPLDAMAASSDALRTGRAIVVNDFMKSEYRSGEVARRYRPASALVAPLVDGAGAVGVLLVHDLKNPRRFLANDEEDARILATIATAALRKVVLVEALTHANRAKTDFLASVSHDLRTPLNIITGYAQLLQEGVFGPLAAEQEDTLARMLRTAGEQLALIDDLLDLARIEQGKLACTPQAMAVASVVPSLAQMMEALLRDRPVRFELDVPPDVVAHADPERVRQVLVNLLANAAKFTNEGCVRLVAAADPTGVRIAVEDTGPGIEPELRAHVLEPFVRGTTGRSGSGLGLAIVARLVDAMRGTIAIDSEPGRGTRVELRLPAA
jgi:signal transduction histidine kinase